MPDPAVREGSRVPPTLQVGTLTFLFTEGEGSSRLCEQDPEAMRAASASTWRKVSRPTRRRGIGAISARASRS
jgi:hypothetical protein